LQNEIESEIRCHTSPAKIECSKNVFVGKNSPMIEKMDFSFEQKLQKYLQKSDFKKKVQYLIQKESGN